MKLLIHATNVSGVGASQVVTSFIDAASDMGLLNQETDVYLPSTGMLSIYQPKSGLTKRYKRFLPNSISRLIEILFAAYIFPQKESVVVLGDIPLRNIKNQIVLVHQPNLIYPTVNILSSRKFTYRVFRMLFSTNLKYADQIVVQTQVMASELEQCYPKISGKIKIIPQPAPNWFKLSGRLNNQISNDCITLFYPAAGYIHKNHKFLHLINDLVMSNQIEDVKFEIWLTLSDDEFAPYENIKFVKNLGRLNPAQMMSTYERCNSLLFLSLMESYGLPLVEALKMSLPIVCVDLPYANWMCDNNAYFFSHKSAESFLAMLRRLKNDIINGVLPDYKISLEKFPNSWEDVVNGFLE